MSFFQDFSSTIRYHRNEIAKVVSVNNASLDLRRPEGISDRQLPNLWRWTPT
jgi:hypothetical protein